ncbi:MAG: hypothetical protein R3A52_16035 [Polyangiales bacterium]
MTSAPRRGATSRAPAAVTLAAGAAVLVGGVTALVFAHGRGRLQRRPGVPWRERAVAARGVRVTRRDRGDAPGRRVGGRGRERRGRGGGRRGLGRASSRRERAGVECGPTTGAWGLRCGLRF